MFPLVSVCICTYNAEKFIEETLKTVLNQTYKNMEILILDNNSSDHTLEILKKYEKLDSRIKIYSSLNNLGAYNWLNKLIGLSKWKYIAIQDHDDLWKKNKIEKQVYFLEKNQNYVGCWTYTIIWYEWDNKCFYYDLDLINNRVIHPSLMFRNNGYYYDWYRDYMSDCYFMKKILCSDWKKLLFNIPDLLTIHRVRLWLNNYSYSRFKLNKKNLNTLFYCHSPFYAFLCIWFEFIRKYFYRFMSLKSRYKFERLPFILMWKKIRDYVKN